MQRKPSWMAPPSNSVPFERPGLADLCFELGRGFNWTLISWEGWVPLSKQVYLADDRIRLNETACAVLVGLTAMVRKRRGPSSVSLAKIAGAVGCTAGTARRALGQLQSRRLASVDERYHEDGGRQANAYEVTALG